MHACLYATLGASAPVLKLDDVRDTAESSLKPSELINLFVTGLDDEGVSGIGAAPIEAWDEGRPIAYIVDVVEIVELVIGKSWSILRNKQNEKSHVWGLWG